MTPAGMAVDSDRLVAALDVTLNAAVVADIRDSVAANTWAAYRSDLADLSGWLAGRDWTDPHVIAEFLRTLETAGVAYATIERRTTSIAKLVEVLAATGHGDPAVDPTKHPAVKVALKAIRRRLGTDQDQATPLTAERLIQTWLTPDHKL